MQPTRLGKSSSHAAVVLPCLTGIFLACPLLLAAQPQRELIAASGLQAAGLPAGVSYGLFSEPHIDAMGNVAFRGDLAGSGIVPRENDRGV